MPMRFVSAFRLSQETGELHCSRHSTALSWRPAANRLQESRQDYADPVVYEPERSSTRCDDLEYPGCEGGSMGILTTRRSAK